ncbi:phosphomevalonate kinase [Tupanvirus deep ocean]|uniref:Phosphomevalonate kinase n=2 Tax=Tupanvirus TaxID=2094720 RepID=A0AC62A741_9VIRU|nr:phosphomevalonate kinase [Tupanvirus deep ocean]QKU33508.1 phosphomevalonate kinase [Tupanvirus deep ocean]
MENIICLIVLSGKRYVGKDYCAIVITEVLKSLLSDINIKFVHVTTEIKREFAEYKNLDFNKLQFDREYKESHRVEMTKYSNVQMEKFGMSYYNKLFCENVLAKTTEPTIYIVDCRYKFEINIYKKLEIPLILVRINAKNKTKERHGWKYDPQIDEHPSETDLDNYDTWQLIFNNDVDGILNITEFTDNLLYPKIIHDNFATIA